MGVGTGTTALMVKSLSGPSKTKVPLPSIISPAQPENPRIPVPSFSKSRVLSSIAVKGLSSGILGVMEMGTEFAPTPGPPRKVILLEVARPASTASWTVILSS